MSSSAAHLPASLVLRTRLFATRTAGPLMASFMCACVGDIVGGGHGGAADADAGLVFDQVVDDDNPPPDLGMPTELHAGERAVVANTGGLRLRVRTGPGYQYPALGLLEPGTIVDVLDGPQEIWFQIRAGSLVGWVHGYYLEPVESGDAPDAGTGAEPLDLTDLDLLLPWTAGDAHRVSQGHLSGSHTGNGGWAWDFSMDPGTMLLAAHDGTVRLARGDSQIGGCSPDYGAYANYVVIDRGDGSESLYLHLKSASVMAGDTVQRGDPIGTSGATGWACGAHLHFQVQRSPDGGGGLGWYNVSMSEYFHDTGAPLDPLPQTYPVSANGGAGTPAPAPPGGSPADLVDMHRGGDWDGEMQRVGQ